MEGHAGLAPRVPFLVPVADVRRVHRSTTSPRQTDPRLRRMTFTRAFPWNGRSVFIHSDHGTPPYWIATIDGVDIFTAVLDLGADNVDEVTIVVQQWIDLGAIPMENL